MTPRQLELLPDERPDLTHFDWILVNSSAGKDSQAMLDLVYEWARDAGVLERIVVVHCDLGRVEWAGTAELAAEHAAAYGLRFEIVRRPQGDLLEHIEARGMFPSSAARYCTSDHKTSQVAKLMTALVRELEHLGRPVRILNCLGIRSEESPARARKTPLAPDRASNGRRDVVRWLPIFRWTTAEVLERCAHAPTRMHPAYALGMPRLSCCFCVLSSRSALVLAARHNPDLAQEYVRVELKTRHRFTEALSMAEIVAEAAELEADPIAEGWDA